MKAASEATLANKADLGIIFDTDVDRAAVVDSDGTEINRDRLIALLAGIRACNGSKFTSSGSGTNRTPVNILLRRRPWSL